MKKNYSSSYSENGFWDKIGNYAKQIGQKPLLDALKLYFAMSRGKATPTQVAAVIAALGYLICPVDAVPDIIGPAGYVDDASVMAAAVAALSCCANPEVIAAAKAKLREWFD